VSLESSCSFSILFSLFSGILAWAFISLQIKEFRVMGFSINDSVYSSVFSLLTGLHFFHLVVGLFLLSLYYCSCSFHCKIDNLVTIRSSEVHLYYNLQVFYWHFLESLWLFIFLVLYLAYILGLTLHKLYMFLIFPYFKCHQHPFMLIFVWFMEFWKWKKKG
jgi:heme/copper-type cytochrome/quinol oxidase subunit 3